MKLRLDYCIICQLCISGRIHSAVVSNIDWSSKSVTVEWSEAEEIKGKEVNNTFYALNDCHVIISCLFISPDRF